MNKLLSALAAGAAVLALTTGPGMAQDLPESMAVTAYDVGSSGYAQAVAIGAAFKNNEGVTLRVLPGKNDVSRMVPLREGKVDYSFNGVGTFFSLEAVDVFATSEWGPQDLRMSVMAMGDNCLTVFFAGDAGIETMADLKGKRVAWVKGSPALNNNTYGHLRFGNLTWDDVEMVEVGGNNGAFDAVLNNQADAFFSTTTSGNILKVQASPRGLVWPSLPHDDEEGWARLKEVTPYFSKHICKEAGGNPEPWEGASYPYPVIISYASSDADTTYALTKAIFDNFDYFKDAAPAATGYALEKQVMDWVVPFHDGAIRYYKEVGKWTDEAQAHNEELIARLNKMTEIWKSFTGSNPPAEGEKFKEAWMEYRYNELQKAGLNPIWREF